VSFLSNLVFRTNFPLTEQAFLSLATPPLGLSPGLDKCPPSYYYHSFDWSGGNSRPTSWGGKSGPAGGYLLGESDDHDLFKAPEMLKRFKDLKNIGAKEREHILFALDSMLKNIKLKSL